MKYGVHKNQIPSFFGSGITLENTPHYMIKTIGDIDHDSFNLRPDLVLSNSNSVYAADTKWKLLDRSRRLDNISQSDAFCEPMTVRWFDANKKRALYVLPFDLEEGRLKVDRVFE